MKKKVTILTFLLLSLSIALYSEIIEFKIIHTNDMHGRALERTSSLDRGKKISGFASLKTLINREKLLSALKGEKFFLFDLGDAIQGTIFGEYRKGVDIINLMNSLGYELWVLGNHEFDFGQKKLKKLVAMANFPVLCSNVKLRGKNGNLISIDTFIKDYYIIDVAGIKIGLFGLSTPALLNMSVKNNVENLYILPTDKTIRKNIDLLKKLGVNILIMASHMGIQEDTAAAKKFPELDIIIGSHSHTFLEKPLFVNGVLIAQTGAYLTNAGKILIKYDADRSKIIMKTSSLLKLVHSKYPNNLRTENTIDKLNSEASIFAEQTLGISEDLLLRKVPGLGQLPAAEIKKLFFTKYKNYLKGFYISKDQLKPTVVESNLCSLVTDLMKKSGKADISMMNPGGLRSNILKGNVKYKDVFQVIPFANSIATCKLTGSQINSIMQKSASALHGGGIMYASGIKFRMNPFKPVGSRIYDITFNGKKLVMNKLYKVATTNFTMMGGDGFEEFTQGKDSQDTSIILREELKKYFIKNSPVKYSMDNRVILEMKK